MTTTSGVVWNGTASRATRWVLVGLVVVALALAYGAGRAHGGQARWETMDAELYDEGETVVFVDDDGSGRFVVRSSVPWWYDTVGSLHDGGMPDCLAPWDADLPGWENVREDVRFAWVAVGGSPAPGRVVVGVDCSA